MSFSEADPPHVLVVDDEEDLCELIALRLEHHGYRVSTTGTRSEALEVLEREAVDALLLDVRLHEDNGLRVLADARRRMIDVPVVVLTAHGTIELAIEATQNGAYAFLTKPFHDRELLARLEQAVTHGRRRRAASELQHGARADGAQLVGTSSRMREVRATIARVARSDATVLLLGESGTGKEVAARALHAHSGRSGRMVAVNCGALSPELLESELFGHLRGAFTGAFRDKEGLFAMAEGGTLFLDEIGDAPASVQVKLLRVLQERTYVPIGALEPRRADVRVIAATNRDLRADMEAGRFREDLFYRLHVMPIHMPPLRERRDDVPLLAELFLMRAAAQHGRSDLRFSPAALDLLVRYEWPGNVRELANVVEGAALLCHEEAIAPQHLACVAPRMAEYTPELARPNPRAVDTRALPAPVALLGELFAAAESVPPMREARQAFDRAYLTHVLARASGNVSAAARLAGRNRTDFYDLLHRYELNPLHFRG